LQLREKQKVKRLYGLLEKQFSNLMREASRKTGQSGAILLELLERRADNVVYRAGFANSRRAARQLVTHGHFMLNGRRIDIPSIRLNVGDVLTVRPRSTNTEYFKNLDNITSSNDVVVSWIKVDRKKLTVTVSAIPPREEAEPEINEQLIVEYYSR
jgi:small subunit ribosomal protein S4